MNASRRRLPWTARSVIAGTTGTAALSFAYAAERRLRPHHPGPLDYDDSLVPGQIGASLAFGATLMTATLTLFPLLGRTPPPSKWPPSVMATAWFTHAAYVGALA